MLGEEASGVLPQAVGGIPCKEELAHAGVDEAVTRASLCPAGDFALDIRVFGLWRLPFGVVIVLEAAGAEEAGAEFAGGEAEVVAPEELEADGCCAFGFAFAVARGGFAVGGGGVFKGEEGGVDLAGGEGAEGKEGGEFGGEVGTEGAVAGVFVGGHCAGGDEVGEAGVGGGFAAGEGVGGCGGFGHGWGVWEREAGGGEGFQKGGDGGFEGRRDCERRRLRRDLGGEGWELCGCWKDLARSISEWFNLFAVACEDIRQLMRALEWYITVIHEVFLVRPQLEFGSKTLGGSSDILFFSFLLYTFFTCHPNTFDIGTMIFQSFQELLDNLPNHADSDLQSTSHIS